MQTDRVRSVLVILFLLALFLGSLAGCGGGGGSPGDTSNNAVKLQASTGGSLAVTIGSLPSGSAAFVHVSGPGNYSADLAGSQTLDGLAPGEYTIAALPVLVGTSTWLPAPETQTVTVVAGATAAAGVSYLLPAVPLALRPAS